MTRRIGGLMDYSRLMPAQKAAEEIPKPCHRNRGKGLLLTAATATSAESDIAYRVRALRDQGLGIRDISITLNLHEQQIRELLKPREARR